METENMILCGLCMEHYDIQLVRWYRYISIPDGKLVIYCACEDCIHNEIKYNRTLGKEIGRHAALTSINKTLD